MNKIELAIAKIKNRISRLAYIGSARLCPLCGKSSSRFIPHGEPTRLDVICPVCGSFERHRFLWLYLTGETDILKNGKSRVLHIAPELSLEKAFRSAFGTGYITADLENPGAMVQMDITAIDYPDESFDGIICSHVLEHVQEDRIALRELLRVLDRKGWALLVVPITAQETFEDPSITDPGERLRLFGQVDHVRRCGNDYVQRIKDAGFRVETVRAKDFLTEQEILKYGLALISEELYFCTR